MAIHYHCRHCGTQIGTIDQTAIHSQTLGLHTLTDQERQEMVNYDPTGHIHIKAICEDCHEALERNPDLHQYDFLIH